MANLNRVMLIGRLTRDITDEDIHEFTNGGRVARFTVAVNNKKKNTETGKWDEEPAFIDAKLFKRGEFDRVEFFRKQVRKGNQVYVEGHLRQERWTDQNTQKERSKIILYVDDFQILESPRDGSTSSSGYSNSDDYAPPTGGHSDGPEDYGTSTPPPQPRADEPTKTYGSEGKDEEIPF